MKPYDRPYDPRTPHDDASATRTAAGVLFAAAVLALVGACSGDPGDGMSATDTMSESGRSAEIATASADVGMAEMGTADGGMYADAGMDAGMGTGTGMGAAAWEPELTADGRLKLPPDALWREWPYVGTPLTPNALNGGEAPFPEFHSVYIDPASWEHWRETGTFRDGTVLAKELTSVFSRDAHPDGSTDQVSGRGYFMGEFSGFEIAWKSAEHFPDAPGNWAYFTFGHHAPPYAAAVAAQPLENCSNCHQASAAQDFVFTQFYPVLRSARGDARSGR